MPFDDIAFVPLARRDVFAIIDIDDASLVLCHRWHLNNFGYAVRHASSQRRGSEPSKIYLHRFLMDAPKGCLVDHANGDRLDNRRSNLRVASKAQNAANSRLSTKNTSGFRGVYWDRSRCKWHGQITIAGKVTFLGYFQTAIEGAMAYDRAARIVHGAFARLNFPD